MYPGNLPYRYTDLYFTTATVKGQRGTEVVLGLKKDSCAAGSGMVVLGRVGWEGRPSLAGMKILFKFSIFFLYFISVSCKVHKLSMDEYCNDRKYSSNKRVIIDFTHKLSFEKETCAVVEIFELENFVNCLKKSRYEKLEIRTYYNGGSIFEMERGFFRAMAIQKVFTSYGLDKDRIQAIAKYDKTHAFEFTSPYRRVEIIVHK